MSAGFLPPGTKVVFHRKDASLAAKYRTTARAARRALTHWRSLLNYASASGSEVVAGALKDLNRAIIVGETTSAKVLSKALSPCRTDPLCA